MTKNNQTLSIFSALAVLMALTRFNHFGSSVSLPDASLAVFFLGGLYLSQKTQSNWTDLIAFLIILLESVLIDFYATTALGVSDWCITPAYWSLSAVYGALWLSGHAISNQDTTKIKGFIQVNAFAWVSVSGAFVLSNLTFYLFSGKFSDMSVTEYAARVAQYYTSYAAFAMLYISIGVALKSAFKTFNIEKQTLKTE
jgi:hypothetical protein